MSRFPWAALIRAGIGQLRWSPHMLWQATPRELIAALAPATAERPDRNMLDALMARFPDRQKDPTDGC